MDRLPPPRLLRVFETVDRMGGVKHAAQELNVSLPAVSQALRHLEHHIGTSLFDRSTRPARLTAAGEILLKAVTDNRERLMEALSDIDALETAANTVTIACTMGFATYWLMPRLEAFYLDHPDIVVNVQTIAHEVPSLGAGTDIAMRYGDGNWRDGAVHLLFEEHVEPVCAPGLAARISEEAGSLASAFLIHVEVADKRWISWPQYFSRTSQKANGSAKGLRFSNYVQATQAALSGHGVMLGWRSITGDQVAKGLLVQASLPAYRPPDAYHAVLSSRSKNVETAGVVVDWLKQIAHTETL
ncbi:LysR family transcriptional regulator [Alphaproteobacteria bacterium AO1-B]|nr:LysR family transcriptional regulator [Alphaproteobacteria bacterium AO1-B]